MEDISRLQGNSNSLKKGLLSRTGPREQGSDTGQQPWLLCQPGIQWSVSQGPRAPAARASPHVLWDGCLLLPFSTILLFCFSRLAPSPERHLFPLFPPSGCQHPQPTCGLYTYTIAAQRVCSPASTINLQAMSLCLLQKRILRSCELSHEKPVS